MYGLNPEVYQFLVRFMPFQQKNKNTIFFKNNKMKFFKDPSSRTTKTTQFS